MGPLAFSKTHFYKQNLKSAKILMIHKFFDW